MGYFGVGTNTVETQDIQDSAVTTPKIADNAVTGAKIALTSQAIGDVMYYDGTDWVRLAAGTPGYLLQTNGAAAPTWVLAPTSAPANSQIGELPLSTNLTTTSTTYANVVGADNPSVLISRFATVKIVACIRNSGNNASYVSIRDWDSALSSVLTAADDTRAATSNTTSNAVVTSSAITTHADTRAHLLMFRVVAGTGTFPSAGIWTA